MTPQSLDTPVGKSLQQRALESEDKSRLLQTALDHIEHGIQMIDPEGRIVVVNARAIDMLGMPAELMATQPFFADVVALQWQTDELSQTREQLRARFHEELAANHSECYRRLRPNGRMLEVNSVPLPGGGMVRTHTDITERYEAEARINFLARHDALTGLANRVQFQEHLEVALGSNEGVAGLVLDLDRFKEVNDTHGHPVGDALLKLVAARLQNSVRECDVVARLGGDEFAVVQTPLPRLADTEQVAARIIESVSQPFQIDGTEIVIGVSIGISSIAPTALGSATCQDPDQLLRNADLALYEAKADGRSTWRVFHSDMRLNLLTKQTLEVELRRAIAEEQFEVFYQPLINLQSGLVSGFEALLRWHHPHRGLLAASEFISTVEATGLVVPVGAWVLRRACRDAAEWPLDVRLLVNLSPMQLRSPNLVETVRDALGSNGLSPTRLELEITETSLLELSEAMNSALRDLRALGIRIALDDFGTGYSSLSHVRLFPFDTIKIDKSFVDEVTRRRDCDAIVRAVTGLARDLGIRTIAEGVETTEQLAWLHLEGCDESQGYFFSPPRPIREAKEMLAQAPWCTDRAVGGRAFAA